MIQLFETFLPNEIYKEFKILATSINWSNQKKLDSKYSSHFTHTIPKELYKNKIPAPFNFIFNKLSHVDKVEYRPHSMYFNVYKHGDECGIHTDNITNGKNKTIIIYLTETWKADWHGETLFYSQDDKKIIGGSIPYPNNAVCFDSSLQHGVSPISRFCTEDRLIFVAQMETV